MLANLGCAENGQEAATAAVELAEDLNEEDEESEEENALLETAAEAPTSAKKAVAKKAIVWTESTKSVLDTSTTLYRQGSNNKLHPPHLDC